MSLLYSSNFKYPDGELRKHQEFMDSSHYDGYQQQNQNNSSLARYRSAPSSFLESLVNGTGDQGGDADGTGRIGSEDYSYFRSSSPEMDTMLARFVSACNGTVDSTNHDLQEFGESPAPARKEVVEGSQMVYQSLSVHDSSVASGNSLASTYSVVNSMDLEISVQETKTNTNSGSNLPRQNSSPASFFSGIGVDNGFSMMRDVGNSRACDRFNGEASPSSARLNNHINFSSAQNSSPASFFSGIGVDNGFSMMRDVGNSRACDRFNGEASPSSARLNNHINFSSAQRVLPRIAEIGDETTSASNPGGNVGKRQYMPNFKNDSWSDNLNGLKRLKTEDGIMFSGLNNLDSQNGNSANRLTGLTHHLSLPKTAAEMATAEKFLQFQGSAPCKIRAKRGFATHPRSIAERVRRTRISERMRKLQELFPDMDKQTNTADMLDLAVEHIKNLQKQVKTLKDTKAKCMCSSTQKQCPSPLA